MSFVVTVRGGGGCRFLSYVPKMLWAQHRCVMSAGDLRTEVPAAGMGSSLLVRMVLDYILIESPSSISWNVQKGLKNVAMMVRINHHKNERKNWCVALGRLRRRIALQREGAIPQNTLL